MAASVVPVIYDLTSKKLLRWFILDFESQLTDPAWSPQLGEGVILVPVDVYNVFVSPNDLQTYVTTNVVLLP